MTARAVRAQLRVELLLTLRRGESLLVAFVIPLGILVLFGTVDLVPIEGDDPVAFLVPGILALSVMSSAMVGLGIATGFERRYGVLKRLGSTPLGRGGLVAAKTVAVLAVLSVQCVLVVGTGVALGWSVPRAIVPGAGILLVGTLAFAGLGLLLAGTLRAELNLAAANGLFLVLLFLGGIAYPLDELPLPLRAVGEVLPAFALSESLRTVLDGTVPFATGAFAVLVGWALLTPALAARWFRWEE